jgi:hypothetical protein
MASEFLSLSIFAFDVTAIIRKVELIPFDSKTKEQPDWHTFKCFKLHEIIMFRREGLVLQFSHRISRTREIRLEFADRLPFQCNTFALQAKDQLAIDT